MEKTSFYEEISKNKIKSYILVVFFSFLVILLGILFVQIFLGNYIIGLIFAFIFSIIFSLIGYYSGDSMILTMSRAKLITKKEDPFLVNTVEGLAIAAGIPPPKVYVIEEDSPNAFATGRDPKHSSITVTSGLRKKLNRQELEGVIAHEMSHIKNYDIRFMLLVTILLGIVALLSNFMLRSFMFGGGRKDSRGGGILGLGLIVLALVLAILAPIIANLIKLAVSRKREFLADASGAQLTRYPQGLADALKKIRDDEDKIVDTANKAMAHLYIENPLRKKKASFWNEIWNTHPDINERIKRLGAM